MEKLSLNLTIEEINLVLEALGQMPYGRVYQLIGKIQQQAEAQLQADHHAADDKLPGPDELA